jgi:hypothetical protein
MSFLNRFTSDCTDKLAITDSFTSFLGLLSSFSLGSREASGSSTESSLHEIEYETMRYFEDIAEFKALVEHKKLLFMTNTGGGHKNAFFEDEKQ